jgi:hypothetical protein
MVPSRQPVKKYYILHLNHVILMFNILHVHWFTNFCNVSVHLLVVTHLPEDGRMSDWNM